ncbi:MAG TPA: saccharopine dehydrogenase C-terminal domain-containing protein [Actinomycetota bacterium]|nr:saccharopine dehydrogenase C-terminal domain-containing protein [Actinomycetota bacterium]
MRIAILGAGIMGSATARLLARRDDVDLVVVDPEEGRAEAVVRDVGRGEAATTGLGDPGLVERLRSADALAACIPYRLNLEAMEAALEARIPYADLGGLFHMTRRQLELDDRFREAGVPAVLGVGCCPGISNVLARAGADRLDEVSSIDIYDGALEESDSFGVPYSLDTMLDEFARPAMVFEDGRLREVPAGSGSVRYRFPAPLGEMEAVYTLHSEPATLPDTIAGVRDVRWRLALPPKVADGFRLLTALGLASEEPVDTPSGRVVPRDVLRALAARLPAPQGPPTDVEILVVEVRGARGGRPTTFTGSTTFRPTPEGIGGGPFGTSIPLAVTARWLASGRIPPGVYPPENALAADEFLAELEAEGVGVALGLDRN